MSGHLKQCRQSWEERGKGLDMHFFLVCGTLHPWRQKDALCMRNAPSSPQVYPESPRGRLQGHWESGRTCK